MRVVGVFGGLCAELGAFCGLGRVVERARKRGVFRNLFEPNGVERRRERFRDEVEDGCEQDEEASREFFIHTVGERKVRIR